MAERALQAAAAALAGLYLPTTILARLVSSPLLLELLVEPTALRRKLRLQLFSYLGAGLQI
jgi:hypothetical protein